MTPGRSGDTTTAAFIEAVGPASSIRVGPLALSPCGPTDVVVEVESLVVNPVDTLVRSGRFRTAVPLPFVVGRDLVGTVVRAGDGTTSCAPGDRVWCNSLGHEGRQGSFARLVVAPSDRVYRLPAAVDPDTAVAVVHPAATAYLAWFVHAGLRAGQTVYVGGAGGNVGTSAVQMAAQAGARVIAAARPAEHERCRQDGADVTLDYAEDGLVERVIEHAPEGVAVVWDCGGHLPLEVASEIVAVGGRILATAAPSARVDVPLWRLYTRDVSVIGFVISRATVSDLADAADLINDMLGTGTLTARITDRLPLAQTAAAHERMEAGGIRGRLIVHPA